MFNKFKINDVVMVNGKGKDSNKYYKNKRAVVICRDPYYLDYNVRFQNGTEDWFEESDLRKIKRRVKK